MKERHQFIAEYLSSVDTVSELCARFGISHKTADTWITRSTTAGSEGLHEASRAPPTCPQRTPADRVAVIRAAREQHPSWGPRTLRPWLERHYPDLATQLPVSSTIGAILKRESLVQSKSRRRRWPHPNPEWRETTAPNACWSADGTGEFNLRDESSCDPLTIEHGYSRFLLAGMALPSVARGGVQPSCEQLFHADGLPAAIRTDNGPPAPVRPCAA